MISRTLKALRRIVVTLIVAVIFFYLFAVVIICAIVAELRGRKIDGDAFEPGDGIGSLGDYS